MFGVFRVGTDTELRALKGCLWDMGYWVELLHKTG